MSGLEHACSRQQRLGGPANILFLDLVGGFMDVQFMIMC